MQSAQLAGTTPSLATVDPEQVGYFDSAANSWWDFTGPARWSLRYLPLQISFIANALQAARGGSYDEDRGLSGLRILDVGCGGGLLCESLARLGAIVCGIDPGPKAIAVAQEHAQLSHLQIDYRCVSTEDLVAEGVTFDLVVSTEVLEHVPDRAHFVRQCAALVAPGGVLVLSTINRTIQSYIYAILFGEYLLRLLPVGTHQWGRFSTPQEIARILLASDLAVQNVSGAAFDPLRRRMRTSKNARVNFMLGAVRG